MASPLQPGKQSVDLAAGGARGSRIRRDPAPAQKQIAVRDPDERDARTVVIGVVSFALALFVIIIGSSNVGGRAPSEYVLRLDL